MQGIIPDFICRKFDEKSYHGEFEAVCLYLDISGFTQITERLMSSGKEGAEELSKLVNSVFEPLIEIVHEKGGFISHFAGDAFFALFPCHGTPSGACDASVMMIRALKANNARKTVPGGFEVSGKIGISLGKLKWAIIGKTKDRLYYFRGAPIYESVKCCSSASKFRIITDRDFIDACRDYPVKAKEAEGSYFELIDCKIPELSVEKTAEKGYFCRDDILREFIPDEILKLKISGEFRYVASLFIGFDNLSDDLIIDIQQLSNEFGKKVFRVLYGDKGDTIMVIFGAPISYENNIQRGVRLVSDVRDKFPGIRLKAGITHGQVYTGIIGGHSRFNYDILGNVVNLSARFMEAADWNEILISHEAEAAVRDEYDIEYLGKRHFKGIKAPKRVYSIIRRRLMHKESEYSAPIIGRKEETGTALEWLKPLQEGRSAGIIYIYGIPGIGKSRLAAEVVQRFDCDKRVFVMKTDNIIETELYPFIYALKGYFEQLKIRKTEESRQYFENIYDNMIKLISSDNIVHPEKESIINELKRTKSILAALLGIYWKDSLYEALDPKGRYENTLFSLRNFFLAQSLICPVILLAEDIHWLDDASKEAFKLIFSDIDNFRIGLIATGRYNDDNSRPVLFGHENTAICNEINLRFLEDMEIDNLIQSQFKSRIDNRLRDFIRTKSSGNPFYIEQFYLYLSENDLISIENGKASLVKTETDIPAGINHILISRIDRLSLELKQAVQIASVLGREFETNLLVDLINVVDKELSGSILDELIGIGKQEQIWAPLSEIRYIFKHALLHEAVYNMQLKTNLRKLHRMAGELIEKEYSGTESKFLEIANHFDKAEQNEKAVLYYRKALSFLLKNFSNKKALDVLERLIELTEEKSEIIRLYMQKSDVLLLFAEWNSALSILYKAMEMLPEPSEKTILELEIKNRIANVQRSKGEYSESIEIASSVIESIKNEKISGSEDIYSRAISILGNNYQCMSDYKKAMEYYDDERKIYEKEGNDSKLSRVLINIGYIFFERGDYENALLYYNKSRDICEKLDLKANLAPLLVNIGGLYFNTGDTERAMELFKKSRKIFEEIGNRRELGIITGNMGSVYFQLEDYEKALECFRFLKKISLEIGDKAILNASLTNIGAIHYAEGRYKEALLVLEKARELACEAGDKMNLINILTNLGSVFMESGKYDRASELFENARSICREVGYKYGLLVLLAQIGTLHYSTGLYEKAYESAEALKKLTDELKIERFRFEAQLLESKVLAKRDNNTQPILKMLTVFQDIKETGRIHYEIWKITGDNCHREKSLGIYKQMLKEKPSFQTRKLIDELK